MQGETMDATGANSAPNSVPNSAPNVVNVASQSQPQIFILQPHQVIQMQPMANSAPNMAMGVSTGGEGQATAVVGGAVSMVPIQQAQQQQPGALTGQDPNTLVFYCCGECCTYTKNCCAITMGVVFGLAILTSIFATIKWTGGTSWGGEWPTEYTVIAISCMVLSALIFLYYIYGVKPYEGDKICWIGSSSITFGSILLCCGTFWLICTCFDADSTVWVRQDNNINNYNNNEYFEYDIISYENYNYKEMTLRDVNVGDWILTVDPVSKQITTQEILMQIHYHWYDNGFDYYSMRKIYLENNVSYITLSDDHLLFISTNPMENEDNNDRKYISCENNINDDDNELESCLIMKACDVMIGDYLYYFDFPHSNETRLLKVTNIIDSDSNEAIKVQKRIIFTMTPYLLINNIIASPYVGAHPLYHNILHSIFIPLITILRYVAGQFVLSMIAALGLIGIFISSIIYYNFWEFVALIATITVAIIIQRKMNVAKSV